MQAPVSEQLSSTPNPQATAPNTGDHARRPGVLERAFTKLFMRPAMVVKASELSQHFRLIDFQSEALKDASWSPGDKVQVKLDGGFITRTYTPIEWDRDQGTTRFLAYCHGAGPGSEWAKQVVAGDERQFFGPRSSISLQGLTSSTILFGDETSFALALALEKALPSDVVRRYVFEVDDRLEAASVLHQVGLTAPLMVERRGGDDHLPEVAEAISQAAESATTFILTGKAASIQYISRALKAAGVGTGSLRTKAYWAPGKVGLD